MAKQHRWLRSEIDTWRDEGLVSAEQALQLQQRYADNQADADWARIVPMAGGAVIFGLGVILFFAYNWADMHRFIKLGLIALALLSAHTAGVWFNRPGHAQKALADALHIVGTMLFGAGIWLIAQIYHIDEHYPNAFLIWGLAATGMAWMLPSIGHGLLALALLFMWGCFETFDFHRSGHPANWLVAISTVPLALWLRSNLLLFFATAVVVLLHAFALIQLEEDLVYPVLLMTATALLAAAKLVPATTEPTFRPAEILRGVGLALWLVLVFVGTFKEVAISELTDTPRGVLAGLYWGLPAVAALVGWAVVFARPHSRPSKQQLLEPVAILAVLLVVITASFSTDSLQGLTWLVFNLAFLLMGGVTLTRGLVDVRWGLTALGTLMLASIVFARFMDMFDSLLLRAGIFVLVGIGLFAVGQVYHRRKQQLAGRADHA